MFNLTSLNGKNGFAIDGINLDGRAGYSVASVGGINGDGRSDIISELQVMALLTSI